MSTPSGTPAPTGMSTGDDCIFCKIRSGQVPGDFVYRDDTCFVIRDIAPAAPVHLLVIPNDHLAHLDGLTADQTNVIGHMFRVAAQAADKAGLAGSGYRLVVNQRDDAGQVVDHLHLHVLGGKKLGRMG